MRWFFLFLLLSLTSCGLQQGNRVLTASWRTEKGNPAILLLSQDRVVAEPIIAKVGDVILLTSTPFLPEEHSGWRVAFAITGYIGAPFRLIGEDWHEIYGGMAWERRLFICCERPGEQQIYLVCVEDETKVISSVQSVKIVIE